MFDGRLLLAVASADERVDRSALDRSRTDQRDLDDQIVEAPGLQPRESRHLCSRFHLENPDRVCATEHLVHRLLGEVEFGEVDVDVLVFGDQIDRVVQRREHPQTEQIELDQTDCGTVVFVPLQYAAILHPRPLRRTDIGDGTITDHHSTGVDSEMSWHVGDVACEFAHVVGRGVGHLAPGVLLTAGIAERPCHVAHRRSAPIGDHVGDLRAVLAAIPSVHVLDRLFTTVRFDVDVDVRWPVTLG